MENTPYLYETLLQVLGQHAKWLDLRHRQTLAWMMVPDQCQDGESRGMGALCGQLSTVCAKYRAALSPVARQ